MTETATTTTDTAVVAAADAKVTQGKNSVAFRQQAALAPAPVQDKYPVVIGQNLSLTYLASVFRLCTSGLRYGFVDALSELLENDPHARGVTRQRVLQIAGARIEVASAKLPPNDKDRKFAQEIADEVRRQFDNIPAFTQAIGSLAWGIIQGLAGHEVYWNRTSEGGWEIARLGFIHSRRLSFTDPRSTDVYVWDQGTVDGAFGNAAQYGLRVADFPGKFVIHNPQLSGEYAWRDGEGRYIAFYMALKRMIVRATAQDFERTIRPWVLGLFNRDEEKDTPTPAGQPDIDKLEASIKALANGTFNGATLPDSCKIEILRAASTLDAQKFAQWLDGQISKSVLGQTYTSEPGTSGARSASETAEKGTIRLGDYDGQCLADTLERDLVHWIVKFNYPGAESRLRPRVRVHVAEDPMTLLERAKVGTSIDMPIDIDQLGDLAKLPIVDKDDDEARRTRMVGPGKGPTPSDPNELEPNQQEDLAQAKSAGTKAKPSSSTETTQESPAAAQ